MGEYARYQAGTPTNDTPQPTPAERERLHAELTQPGKVIVGSDGTVRVEGPVSSPVTTNADRAANWRDHVTDAHGNAVDFDKMTNESMIYLPDGDRSTVGAAKRAGLLKYDASGRLVMAGESTNGREGNPTAPDSSVADKTQEPQKKDGDDNAKDEGWQSETVDAITATIGRELSAGQLEGLIATAMTGEAEISDLRATSIAQTLKDVSAKEVKESYRVAVQEARQAADAIVVKNGVDDPAALYAWLEQNDMNRAMSVRDSFVRGKTAPLIAAAKDFAATHATMDPADAEYLLDARHTVTGGKLFKSDKGVVMVSYTDGRPSESLASAMAGKRIKVSL
jgi:hypothetical protein